MHHRRFRWVQSCVVFPEGSVAGSEPALAPQRSGARFRPSLQLVQGHDRGLSHSAALVMQQPTQQSMCSAPRGCDCRGLAGIPHTGSAGTCCSGRPGAASRRPFGFRAANGSSTERLESRQILETPHERKRDELGRMQRPAMDVLLSYAGPLHLDDPCDLLGRLAEIDSALPSRPVEHRPVRVPDLRAEPQVLRHSR